MRYPQGQIGWADLSTTDVEAARAYYAGLFGWDSRVTPTPMGVDYTTFLLDGEQVAGMGPMPPDMAAAGVPTMWNAYVIVADADAVVADAVAAGGTVAMPTMDVMTEGRLAMVADPSGAVLGLWQPLDHQGAEVLDRSGSVVWNELQTRDLDAALPFYGTVFGWHWEDYDGSGYQVATLDAKAGDDKTVAGAMTMPEGVPPEAPSMWLVYFGVDDCDTSAARSAELGGQVFLPPMDMGPGRFAGLIDPSGGMFMVGHMVAPEPA